MRTDAPTHRTLKTNGVELKIVEQGSGPLIVLPHGFPETSYSWRHQVPALAAAGHRVVAPRPSSNADIRASLLGMIVKANAVQGADSAIGEDNRPEDYDAATPSCLTEADLDAFAAEFTDCGFGTSIDWYRNMDRNWELLAPFDGAVITPPALYIRGEGDNMASSIPVPGSVAEQREVAPNAREIVTIPDCGHWIQQEQPAAVTAHILKFARELD